MDRKRIAFKGNTPLRAELKRRVSAYLEEQGSDGSAPASMWLKTVVIAVAFVTFYLAFLLNPAASNLEIVLYAVGLSLAGSGIGFSIQHDGGHKAYSHRHPAINRLMAFGLDFLGGSSFMWHWKHNIFHHTYPNIDGIDDDIALTPLARLAPTQPRYAAHRFQWLYIWPLYGLLVVKWHLIDDFRALITGKLGGHRHPRPKGLDLFQFILGKAVWVTWVLIIPVSVVGWSSTLLFMGVYEVLVGLTLATVFQMAHCVEEAEWEAMPAEGEVLRAGWAEHQMATTVDFGRNNPLLTWYVGGLNYQTVHHLFPRICHIHYPAISKILEEVSAKHGVRYRLNRSLTSSIVSHVRWLKRMGAPPATKLPRANPLDAVA